MRVSDNEVKKVLSQPSNELVQAIVGIEESRVREQDLTLVHDVTQAIESMPDRDDIIEELRARIEAGTYRPTAESIMDGMVRRAIVDQIK